MWYLGASYALLGHTDLAINRFGLPNVAFPVVFAGSAAGFVALMVYLVVARLVNRRAAPVPEVQELTQTAPPVLSERETEAEEEWMSWGMEPGDADDTVTVDARPAPATLPPTAPLRYRRASVSLPSRSPQRERWWVPQVPAIIAMAALGTAALLVGEEGGLALYLVVAGTVVSWRIARRWLAHDPAR